MWGVTNQCLPLTKSVTVTQQVIVVSKGTVKNGSRLCNPKLKAF